MSRCFFVDLSTERVLRRPERGLEDEESPVRLEKRSLFCSSLTKGRGGSGGRGGGGEGGDLLKERKSPKSTVGRSWSKNEEGDGVVTTRSRKEGKAGDQRRVSSVRKRNKKRQDDLRQPKRSAKQLPLQHSAPPTPPAMRPPERPRRALRGCLGSWKQRQRRCRCEKRQRRAELPRRERRGISKVREQSKKGTDVP